MRLALLVLICGQVLTTKYSLELPQHYETQKNCIESLLSCGIIPIVNENDTLSITELMFTDNDELSGIMAEMMHVELLVVLSNVDGVYDGAPSEPGSKVIRRVSTATEDLTGYIKAEKSSHGRGGMLTKYRIACNVAAKGIPVVIANGRREDILLRVVDDPEGTACTQFVP